MKLNKKLMWHNKTFDKKALSTFSLSPLSFLLSCDLIFYTDVKLNWKVKSLVLWCSLQVQFSSVQSLIRVWLFVTPWTAARQDSLSFTNCWSLLKLMSIESVMPSNDLILCCPLLLLPSIFPSIRVFSNESIIHIRWPSIRISASTSTLPINIQGWLPLGWTGWIFLESKGLSRVFCNTTVQKHQFFSTQLSL